MTYFEDSFDPSGFFSSFKLVGDSPLMNRLKKNARDAATRHSSILIVGEFGSGKESLARYIHRNSSRSKQPFIAFDCGAMSDSRMERELFGHVGGSGTGVSRDVLGVVQSAHGGTLFLDDIHELSERLQSKLVCAVKEMCVLPMGSRAPRPVDIRVIGATDYPLETFLSGGSNSRHPFFELDILLLETPPLRKCSSNIIPLAEHFLQRQAELYCEPLRSISVDAAILLKSYSWPGNVREIAQVMEQAHILASDQIVTREHLHPRLAYIEGNY